MAFRKLICAGTSTTDDFGCRSQPQRERGHASERCSGSQPVGAAGGTHFAYRIIGTKTGVPLVLLQHFTGTMDYWDPAAVNGLAKEREVVVFDNTGGGASSRVWASDRMWRSSQPSDVGCRGNDQTLFGGIYLSQFGKAVRKGFVL